MKLLSLALVTFISKAHAGGYHTRISGYAPGSDVVDHGNVDQDQNAMEVGLALKDAQGFEDAKMIYENGGNSKVIATVTLSGMVDGTIPKGTTFSGSGQDGLVLTAGATGTVNDGSTTIMVTYAGGTCQDYNTDKSRCLASSGSLTDGTETYDYTAVSHSAGRTLQGFSTAAGEKMAEEQQFKIFKKYYGEDDYADQLVQAAFSSEATDLKKGNADFSNMGFVEREQLIKKMAAYMNVFMYVFHEFEAALSKCETALPLDAEAPIHAWDEGVAFYSGYLSGIDGAEGGKMVYALAEKRGGDFGTTQTDERSLVNIALTKEFTEGREYLNMADCKSAKKSLKNIKSLMYIPLIQGTIKYAYKTELDRSDAKAVAEGIAFMHAVIARVHDADKEAAKIIYDNMNTGAEECSLAAVKGAFESVYAELGISCAQVGGYTNKDTGEYYEGMSPCSGCDAEATINKCAGLADDADLREKKCKRGSTATKCPSTCAGECSM